MTLAFAGGNTLALAPDTTVVIRRGGATGAELGAVVIAGSARASSPGDTTRLVIGSPFGMTEIGTGELVVDVDLTRGISVLVGEVSVMKDGEAKTIDAGQVMAIDGIVVPVGEKPGSRRRGERLVGQLAAEQCDAHRQPQDGASEARRH